MIFCCHDALCSIASVRSIKGRDCRSIVCGYVQEKEFLSVLFPVRGLKYKKNPWTEIQI